MTYLENAKQYTGSDLENIFFRPILTGQSAQDLGVRVLYNMPQAARIQLWDGQRNILQKFTSAGWTGSADAKRFEKTIDLQRVKAELGFSAADYFSMVYEKVASIVDVNMEDLSGTILEQAETELFRKALAENIRATMWAGDTSAESGYNTFDGFLKLIKELVTDQAIYNATYQATDLEDTSYAPELFDKLWTQADPRAQDLKAEGQLAYFASSDICYLYEKYLDEKGRRLRIHRRRKWPQDTRIPRYPGHRRAHGELPLRHDAPPVVLYAHRPPQPRPGRQHRRHARKRSPHVVQPRRDGEPPARRLHGRLHAPR